MRSMMFCSEEIKLAGAMKARGLRWEPRVGNYVYDMTRIVKKPSPFQDGVFFVLNYSYFMELVGGQDQFKQMMVWLPTWEDCREIVRSFDVSDEFLDGLIRGKAFEDGVERLAAYKFIVSVLDRNSTLTRLSVAD
jgi:hypothetical protein